MAEPAKKKRLTWSETQEKRLRELGVDRAALDQPFSTHRERDRSFQQIERQRVKAEKARLDALLTRGGKPQLETLCETLSETLIAKGFVRVCTPTVISAKALEKMSIGKDHPLHKQVYWLNGKQCLRPMLAPNLYRLMQDFSRHGKRPIRFFEIGSCFRKETNGVHHTSEFTMLNLVELGVAMEKREARLWELGSVVAAGAGVASFRFVRAASAVYGATIDIVAGDRGIEIGSGAMGPHPLDAQWGVREAWVGFGLGVERMLMLANEDSAISRWRKSLGYLDGICLKL